MTFSYDKEADVLYVTLEAVPANSYVYTESENGDVLKIDRNNRRIVGCTILCFMRRLKQGKLVIPEIGAAPFNEIAKELLSA